MVLKIVSLVFGPDFEYGICTLFWSFETDIEFLPVKFVQYQLTGQRRSRIEMRRKHTLDNGQWADLMAQIIVHELLSLTSVTS